MDATAKRLRLLALNSSYRGVRGHTHFLIERIFSGARENGAKCEEIVLVEHNIEHCLACDTCQTMSHTRTACVHDEKDDAHALFERMAGADLVIFATPVYLFGPSALLKTFLERLYAYGKPYQLKVSRTGLIFHEVDAICTKPFVSLICCDNVESPSPRNARDYFRTYSRFMDAPLVGELIRNGGGMTQHGHSQEALRRFPKAINAYRAFEQAGRELAIEGRIRKATARRASQDIVPIPWFWLLKRLPLRSFKEGFVRHARRIRAVVHPDAFSEDK